MWSSYEGTCLLWFKSFRYEQKRDDFDIKKYFGSGGVIGNIAAFYDSLFAGTIKDANEILAWNKGLPMHRVIGDRPYSAIYPKKLAAQVLEQVMSLAKWASFQ